MGCGTIAALTLMGAGTGVSEYANVATKNKMNELASAEQQRQKGFQQQGTNLFNQSLGQSGAPQAQQQVQQGVQQSLGATQQASKIPFGTSTAPLPGKQGNLADLQLKSQLGLGQQANANLMGYGNYGFQQGLKDQNIGGQLGVVNREAQQSAGALPTELNSAQSQYAGLQGLGQLLDVAGMLTGLYGLTAAPAASQGAAASAFDWSNPASWGAAYVQPYGATGALQILPSY